MRLTGTFFVATALLTLLPCSRVLGFSDTPRQILDKTVAAYLSLKTFKAEGTITTDIDSGGVKTSVSTSFTILLKKPDLYRITWSQQDTLAPGRAQSGAVWRDGTQPYLYLEALQAYAPLNSDELALGVAAAVAGGAAVTVPALFLAPRERMVNPFSRIAAPVFERPAMIGDDNCYVISGSSSVSQKETFWIAGKNYLIRQYRRSLEPPAGGVRPPEVSDEQLELSLRALGQHVTEARRQELREMLATATKLLQTVTVKGAATELHAAVSSPELSSAAFSFVPPAGVARKESLFGESVERSR